MVWIAEETDYSEVVHGYLGANIIYNDFHNQTNQAEVCVLEDCVIVFELKECISVELRVHLFEVRDRESRHHGS